MKEIVLKNFLLFDFLQLIQCYIHEVSPDFFHSKTEAKLVTAYQINVFSHQKSTPVTSCGDGCFSLTNVTLSLQPLRNPQFIYNDKDELRFTVSLTNGAGHRGLPGCAAAAGAAVLRGISARTGRRFIRYRYTTPPRQHSPQRRSRRARPESTRGQRRLGRSRSSPEQRRELGPGAARGRCATGYAAAERPGEGSGREGGTPLPGPTARVRGRWLLGGAGLLSAAGFLRSALPGGHSRVATCPRALRRSVRL